jgi:hypothetical protein
VVGNRSEYGLIWRDLKTGKTVLLGRDRYLPTALAMSASGRYVVFSASARPTSYGMNVWLWDTKTGTRLIINRLPDGQVASDGNILGVSVSADGKMVAFGSSSKLLAPPGAIEDRLNAVSNSYIYLYDRATRSLRAMPWSSSFSAPTEFLYPVISADGNAVAFRNGLEAPMIWYPASGLVRPVPLAAETGASDGEGLALSADGGELATDAVGVNVVSLGTSAEEDRLLWMDLPPETVTESVALSADGSKVAFTGGEFTEGPTRSKIWVARITEGPASTLPLPPFIRSLPAAPKPVGGLGNLPVTMTSDGSAVAAVVCSRGYKNWAQCSSRMDFFRWRTGL